MILILVWSNFQGGDGRLLFIGPVTGNTQNRQEMHSEQVPCLSEENCKQLKSTCEHQSQALPQPGKIRKTWGKLAKAGKLAQNRGFILNRGTYNQQDPVCTGRVVK